MFVNNAYECSVSASTYYRVRTSSHDLRGWLARHDSVFASFAQLGLVFKVSVSVSFRGGTLGGAAVAVGRLCTVSGSCAG